MIDSKRILKMIILTVISSLLLAAIRGIFGFSAFSQVTAILCLFFGLIFSGTFLLFQSWVSKIAQFNLTLKGVIISFLFIFSAIHIFYYGFYLSDGLYTGNVDNLGDLGFHLQLIEYFKQGAGYPFINPHFAGVSLHYPYGIDYFDALLSTAFNISTLGSIKLTSLLLLGASFLMLYQWGGLFLLIAFLGSGGGSLFFGSELSWKNLFYSVLLTQRGFLFALPAGVFLLKKWQSSFVNNKRGLDFYFIWASLSFFHLHSFVIISFWILVTSLFAKKIKFHFGGGRFFIWLFWGLWPMVILLKSLTAQTLSSAIAWNWFWRFDSFELFFNNMGLWVLVPLFALTMLFYKKDYLWASSLLVVTFFAVNLQLAPWDWDQIKVLFWVYLLWNYFFVKEVINPYFSSPSKFDLPELNQSAISLSEQKYLLFEIGIALFIFWPGIKLWAVSHPAISHKVYKVKDLIQSQEVGELFKSITNKQDVIISQVTHSSPILGLGYPLFMGYQGHIWSHGYDSRARQELLEYIFGDKKLDKPLFFSPLPSLVNLAPADSKARPKWLLVQDDQTLLISQQNWISWGWEKINSQGSWSLWKINN